MSLPVHFVLLALTSSVLGAPNELPDLKPLVDFVVRQKAPMPPKDARLVLARTAADPAVPFIPAFLLEERPDASVILLVGFDQRTVPSRKGVTLTRPFSFDRVDDARRPGARASFDDSSTFLCAVQVAARGDLTTARAMLKQFAGDTPDRLDDTRGFLAYCIANHLRERALRGPGEWRDVHARAYKLLEDAPELEDEVWGRDWDGFVVGLARALGASKSAAGSVEALLVEWSHMPARGYDVLRAGSGEIDPRVRQILRQGFDAVPALIALRSDERITAHEVPRFNNRPAEILRLGGLAGALLGYMTGPDSPDEPDAKAWQDWWEKTRKTNERMYYLDAVFRMKDGRITEVDEILADIIGHKWPDALPGLCERYTEVAAPDAPPFGLAEAVANSRLPRAERVKILCDFAKRGSFEQRRWVLQVLAPLDETLCAELLTPLLEKMPIEPNGPHQHAFQGYYSQVVTQLHDDDAWRKYLCLVKRCGVGLRMEMLSNIVDYDWNGRDDVRVSTKNRDRRLAFLAAFLDDATVRDVATDPILFKDCSFNHFKTLAVRDLAYLQLASLLDLDEAPGPQTGADAWSQFRADVRRKLAEKKLPTFECAK